MVIGAANSSQSRHPEIPVMLGIPSAHFVARCRESCFLCGFCESGNPKSRKFPAYRNYHRCIAFPVVPPRRRLRLGEAISAPISAMSVLRCDNWGVGNQINRRVPQDMIFQPSRSASEEQSNRHSQAPGHGNGAAPNSSCTAGLQERYNLSSRPANTTDLLL